MTALGAGDNFDGRTIATSTFGADSSQALGLGLSTPRRSVHLAPKTVLNGRYTVERVIGEGGMGLVYEVSDALHPERRVALKTIHSAMLNQERVSLFKAEFKTMAGLRHPNIAAVYDFEPLQGSADYFFTMEYVDGHDLLLATEDASASRIVTLTVEICRALSYLHSRKVIHFDLKPGNILVDRQGHVRVLDFGVSGGGAHSSSLVGTPAYMAPELLSDGSVDHRSDLYSLGIVLYHLICRRVPFAAPSVALMMQKHASESLSFDAEARARVPAWLLSVIERLCAKAPAERYRSANAMIDDMNMRGGTSFLLETADTRESYILSSRFVGRDKERERLLDFIARRTRATRGDGSTAMMVNGLSGVGKSRLLREVKQQVQLSGLPFVEASCYEGAFSEFQPIADALAYVVRLARSVKAEGLIDRYAGALHRVDPRLVPNIEPPIAAAGDRDAERLALIDQLSAFLVTVAVEVPFVLYFNDLQWARPGTTDLLRNLIRHTSGRERAGHRTTLAVLGSYRADEVSGRPLDKLLSAFADGAVLETIALAPLDAIQVDRLLSSMLGIDTLPPQFVERVAAETAGVPFFVEEVMRALVDGGAVYLEQGAWAATAAIGDLEIPASMASVFRRRAALLDEGARATFELMAVYGRPISVERLAGCAGCDEGRAHELLRVLIDRQMVVRAAGAELSYRIGHDRMRETLYGDMGETDRRSVHGSIGDALEAQLGSVGAHVPELAYHFWHAHDRRRALRYGLAAGEWAQQAFSNESAIEHFEHALSLLDDARTGELGMEVSEKLADLECLTGRYAGALVRYQYLLGARGDRFDQARLLRKTGLLHNQRGLMKEACETLWQAAHLLGQKRPQTRAAELRFFFKAMVVHVLHRAFRWWRRPKNVADRARLLELCSVYRLLAEAYGLIDPPRMGGPLLAACNNGERAGDSRELCRAYSYITYLYMYLGWFASSWKYGDAALRLAERLGLSLEIGVAACFRGMSALNAGAYHDALPLVARGRALLLKHGDVMALTFCETTHSQILLARGDLRAAIDGAAEVVQLVERTGSEAYGKSVIASLGYYAGLAGEDETARARLAQALGMIDRTSDEVNLVVTLTFRGHLELTSGDPAAAVLSLDEARALVEKSNNKFYLVGLMYSALALAMLEVAGRSGAFIGADVRLVVRRALVFTKRRQQYRALALVAQATLDAAQGRRRSARRMFAGALALAHAQGALFIVPDVHFACGRALVTFGDRAAAASHFARAAEHYERFGMRPALARVQAEQRAAESRAHIGDDQHR